MGRPLERDRGCLGGSRRAEAGNALVDVVYGKKNRSAQVTERLHCAACGARNGEAMLNIMYSEG